MLTDIVILKKLFDYFYDEKNMEYDFENMKQKSMPKQVKEIAKIRNFDYFDDARFARSQQSGNPLLFLAFITNNVNSIAQIREIFYHKL